MANDKITAKDLQHVLPSAKPLAGKKITPAKKIKSNIVSTAEYQPPGKKVAIVRSENAVSKIEKKKKTLSAPLIGENKTILPKTVKTKTKVKEEVLVIVKNQNPNKVSLKITFQLKFRTQYGQNLYITGNHPLLGNGDLNKALALKYFNEELWMTSIELEEDANIDSNIIYNYILRNADGSFSYDWGSDKTFNPSTIRSTELLMLDAWNYAGYFENAFYTVPFKNVLLPAHATDVKNKEPKTVTHIFAQIKHLIS